MSACHLHVTQNFFVVKKGKRSQDMQGVPVPKGVSKYEDLPNKKGVTVRDIVSMTHRLQVFIVDFEGGAPLKKRYSEFRDLYVAVCCVLTMYLHSQLPDPVKKKLSQFPPKTGVVKASTDVKLFRCKAFDSLVKEMWADPSVRSLKEVQQFFATVRTESLLSSFFFRPQLDQPILDSALLLRRTQVREIK